MISKKGLSTVVTTLIIILLVLVAIGIVWVVIANLVQEGSEQIFLDKFTTDLKIKSVLNVDNSSNSLDVDVKRNVGKGDLAGIKFIFNDGQNSEIVENFTIIDELGEKRFHFILSALNIDNVQTISIAPLYRSSEGKTITGGIIASYRLSGAGILGTCVPNCSGGKICGTDGCGGSCGSCGTGYHCSGDQLSCDVDLNPCDLTSASWNILSVVDGTTVLMNLQGTDCDGKDIYFEIWEDDLLIDDLVPTSPTNPANITFSGTSSAGSWVASWTYTGDDDIGTDPRDYYFIAYVVSETESIISSGGTLAVSQPAAQTCANQGGTICVGGETCSGNIISASDSNRCCDASCTAPATAQVYREFSSSSVSPGGSVDVTLYVYTVGGGTFYVVEDHPPAGWTITNDPDNGLSGDGTWVGWAVTSGAADRTYSYTVLAPTGLGPYIFNGTYGFESMGGSTTDILGDTTVTVA